MAAASPVPARAEVAAEVFGGFNVNWSNVPAGVDPASPYPSSAGSIYLDLRPGAAVQYASARVVLRATYAFATSLHFEYLRQIPYSNVLGLTSAFQVTRRLTLSLGGSAIQGDSIYQRSQGSPDTGNVQALPIGNTNLFTVIASEALAWEAMPRLRLLQRFNAGLSGPAWSMSPLNHSITASVILDYLWRADALGGELRLTTDQLTQQFATGPTPPAQIDVIGAALVRWRHDYGPSWNSVAQAGVEAVAITSLNSAVTLYPAGSLLINYLWSVGSSPQGAAGGSATLGYSRGAAPSVVLGSLTIADTVALRGAVRFGQVQPVTVLASAGYQHNTPADGTQLNTSEHVINADAGVVWRLQDVLSLTARYSLYHQFGAGLARPIDPVNIIMVGLLATYRTTQRITAVPTMGSQRVDGNGDQAFPSGHSPSPDAAPPR